MLSPKRVARAMGVSESSLKRWCDQGLIAMEKTAGGHRRLPLDAVVQFLQSTKRELVHPELLGLPANLGKKGRGSTAAREGISQAIFAGDLTLFRELAIDMLLSGWSIAEIVDDVLAPVFVEVGSAWECHELNIYQERRGCEISLRVLYELTGLLPVPPADGPVAIGCSIWCDPYILPTTAVECVLIQHGWRARSLGNRIPFDSMLVAIRETQPSLFWISASFIDDEEQFIREYTEFYARVGRTVPIVLGGRAIHEGLRRQLNFSTCCDRLQQLESFVCTLSAGS